MSLSFKLKLWLSSGKLYTVSQETEVQRNAANLFWNTVLITMRDAAKLSGLCFVLFGFHYIVYGTLILQRKGTKAEVEKGKKTIQCHLYLFSARIGKDDFFS